MTTIEKAAEKLVEISLTAVTSVQYTEVVAVPADITPDELDALVNDRYFALGGDEFTPIPGSWVRGDCGTMEALSGSTPSMKAVRAKDGILVKELEFNRGLGCRLAEEVELNGEPYVLGKIEVPYRTEGSSGLPSKAVVQAVCDAAVVLLRESNKNREVIVYHRDFHSKPQHCVVSLAVPAYEFETDSCRQEKLEQAFRGFEDIEKLFQNAA